MRLVPVFLQVRQRELHLIAKTAVIKTLNLCLVFAVPPVIALVIFATYAYTVGPLTPAMAFVVLSLFNTLRFPLVVLPKALRGSSGKGRQALRGYWSAGRLGGKGAMGSDAWLALCCLYGAMLIENQQTHL